MSNGLCECGCGQRTRLATGTDHRCGLVEGEPLRFINGHWARSPETRAKISAANRGRKLSPETRAKMSAAQRGPKSYRWKGGRTKSREGYVAVRIPPDHPLAEMRTGGSVYEHRLVMAEAMGRPLSPGEVVHHRNGEPDDNRRENLLLFLSQAAHARHHQELRKAA